MAAIQDPQTGVAPAPVIPAEARLLLPRDPARATAVLYRKFGTTVYRFSWHMLGSKEDAEDATQATFLSVHSAIAGGTVAREPQAWVLKIARNECLARITQRMRRPLMDSIDDETTAQVAVGGPSVAHAVEMRGDLDAASSALGRLPTSQREAFVLREWVGMSTTEIALSLGTTVSAVDALLNRARRELIRVVGGAEGAAGCTETRAGLVDGILDRAARAHLIRCKACRQVRRVMQPQLTAARAIVPPAAIAARLADSLPGFAASGSAAGAVGSAAAGGGGIAAIIAKVATAPAAVKGVVAAFAAAAAVTGGVAVETHSTPSRGSGGAGLAGALGDVVSPAPAIDPQDAIASASIAPVAGLDGSARKDAPEAKVGTRNGSTDHAGQGSSGESGQAPAGSAADGASTEATSSHDGKGGSSHPTTSGGSDHGDGVLTTGGDSGSVSISPTGEASGDATDRTGERQKHGDNGGSDGSTSPAGSDPSEGDRSASSSQGSDGYPSEAPSPTP